MIREGLNSEDGCFRCVKIILLGTHILALIGATVMMFFFMVLLFTASSHEETDSDDKEKIKTVGIFAVFVFTFMVIYEMIAIIGIAKENTTIVMTYLVLSIIGFVSNMFYGTNTGLMTLIVIGLTTYFAVMIHRKQKGIV